MNAFILFMLHIILLSFALQLLTQTMSSKLYFALSNHDISKNAYGTINSRSVLQHMQKFYAILKFETNIVK